jgi:16S rRNA processing protein RimM
MSMDTPHPEVRGASPRDPAHVVVAQVARSHGIRGELFLWSLTDRPESTFAPGAELLVADAGGNDPDPKHPPLVVVAVRPYRKGFLVSVEGVEDRTASDLLRGRYLLRPFDEVDPLDEGEVFYHQLLGLQVVTPGGEQLGRVVEVYHLEPSDLVEVARGEGKKTLLLPFREEVIQGWDLEAGTLVVTPPEGLLEL